MSRALDSVSKPLSRLILVPMADVGQTPMMKQYLRFKADYPDAILFFHLGDFYEVFFEDAEVLSRELDVVLTSRNGHPMAGVPIRRGDAYVSQLLKRPKRAKGLVKRDVVRVVTPGTAIDDSLLDAGANNYLAAAYRQVGEERIGLSFLDLSTGEFLCTVADTLSSFRGEIERRDPSEVLLPELSGLLERRVITRLSASSFSAKNVVLLGQERSLRRARHRRARPPGGGCDQHLHRGYAEGGSDPHPSPPVVFDLRADGPRSVHGDEPRAPQTSPGRGGARNPPARPRPDDHRDAEGDPLPPSRLGRDRGAARCDRGVRQGEPRPGRAPRADQGGTRSRAVGREARGG